MKMHPVYTRIILEKISRLRDTLPSSPAHIMSDWTAEDIPMV